MEDGWGDCVYTETGVLKREAMDAACRPIGTSLVEKAARLQAILDSTVDGILTIDERAIILAFNKAAERIFGYLAEEIVGKRVNVLMPSPHHELHDRYIENYIQTGVRKVIGIGREISGRRKDGSTFPLYLALSETWVGGKRYFTAILRDISKEKKTLEEVRSLARFPEENPHPILRISKEGILIYANNASGCLLRGWDCGVGHVLPDPMREVVLETLVLGETKELEARCEDRTFALTIVPTPQPMDINVYGRDITERKQAEEALRTSEEQHRALVQSTSDAVLMVDKDRRIISYNQAFLDLYGFTKEEVEGESVRILHPTEESFVELGLKAYAALDAHGAFRCEWEFRRKDGTIFPAEQTVSPVRDPQGSILGYVAVIRDVTERRSVEKKLQEYRDNLEEMVVERTRELEEAHKALLQQEKLKTLGTISAEVAHEIRNPLMSIGGFARRLQKKMPDVPEIGIVVHECTRLEELLKRLENYLKPVELRPRECSVNQIIQEAIELMSPELHRDKVSLKLDLAPELALAYADPAVLIQVLVNVVHNAAKVMRKDGRITIETFETDQNVHVCVRAPLGKHIVDPEHVFIPFGEDKEEISVPICFRLLQDMGGHLSLAREDDSVVFAASLLKVLKSPMTQAWYPML